MYAAQCKSQVSLYHHQCVHTILKKVKDETRNQNVNKQKVLSKYLIFKQPVSC